MVKVDRRATGKWRTLVDMCGGKVSSAYEHITDAQNTNKKNGKRITVTEAIEIAIRKITRREEEGKRV